MKDEKNSVRKNYLLNLIVNILTLIIPLVTTPYISRVLGANSIGTYSYCLSIETYFVILGTLGIPIYAKREIASARNDKQKKDRLFSELLTLQVILLLLALLAYLLLTVIINTNYRIMFAMCSIGIFAAIFDVSWLFQGIEDFSTIVKRGIIFKITCVALIFLLVRDESSLYIYAFSLMITNLICNVWLLVTAKKMINYKRPKVRNVLKHLKPSAFLLLPSMVTAIYAVIDKTMIGAMSNNISEVGFYEQSQKIVTVSLAIITALGSVLMPRLTALYGRGEKEIFKKYLNKGLSVLCLLATPIAVGCAIISNNLVPWFYGDGYDKIVYLLKIFSPMYIFMGISDLIGTQTLLALKKEKQLLIVNAITIIINLTINAILIPQFQSIGAAIATLISELIKCICFITISKKYIKLHILIKQFIKYLIISSFMGLVLILIRDNLLQKPTALNTILLISTGSLTYGILIIITNDYWFKQIMQVIDNKRRRK